MGDAEQAVEVLSTPSWPLFAVLGVLGAGLSFATTATPARVRLTGEGRSRGV